MLRIRQLLAAIFICSTLATTCALAQSSLTQIRDLITNSDGTPFDGMVVITWNGFSVPSGTPVSQLSASASIYNGALSVLLVPTTTAAAGTYYSVVFSSSDGTVTWTETWQVPPSTTALTISQVLQSTTQGTGGTTTPTTGQYATLPITIDEITNLSSDLASINSAISSINTQIAGIPTSSTITTLQNTVTSLGTTVSGLSSTTSGLTTTVNGLTTTVNGLSTTVASNSTTVTTLQTSVNTLTTTVSGLSTSLTNLTNTVNGLITTVNNLTSNGSSENFIDAEVPSGTMNGVNTVFNLANTPSPSSSFTVYRNGLAQKSGVDYTLSGAVLTFLSVSVPQSTDLLQAYYRMPGTGSGTMANFADAVVPTGTINGTNLVFTLTTAPSPIASLKLYKNGLLLSQNGDYTISGTTITFASTTTTPQSGDSLIASYRY
jgi:uncharacterized protein YoxC